MWLQNVLVGMFMGYVTGQADPNSAINVVGDAFVNQDPTIIAQAFTDLITSLDLACAFQVRRKTGKRGEVEGGGRGIDG